MSGDVGAVKVGRDAPAPDGGGPAEHGGSAPATIPRHEDEWQCGWCGTVNTETECSECHTEKP